MCPKVSAAHRSAVRERILSATEKLVARTGISGTSMDDIVDESGLSKGAIYGHFPSKEELLLSLQDRQIDTQLTAVLRGFVPDDSTEARIRKLLLAFFSSPGITNRAGLRLNLELLAASLRIPALRSRIDLRYAKSLAAISDLIEDGVREGEFRSGLDPRDVAATLLAVLDGVSMERAFTSRADIPWEGIQSALPTMLFDGIRTARPASGNSPRSGTPRRTRGVDA
jgi:AcrR family transcriptional regulator